MFRLLIVGQALTAQHEAMLRAESFDPIRAQTGEQALSAIRANPPDLLIVRADMTGTGLCHCVRSEPETKLIPILVVGTEAKDVSRALELGANDCLIAPVSELELFARVRSLLRFKLMQDEVRVRISCEAAQFAAIRQAAQNAAPKAAVPKEAPPQKRSPMVDFAKGAIGLVAGISGSIGVLALIFWLISDGNAQSTGPAPAVTRFFGVLVLILGIATARLFQRQNFLALFDRFSFGMKRRLPLAIYASYFLLWIGYLFASKSDFGEWYGENVQKFWLMLTVPPTVAVASLILFRWANGPGSDRQ